MSRITLVEGDTQRLPLPDDTFGVVTVAFGLRNVTDTARGLDEMIRVARPGGKVAVLEFSKPTHPILGKLYLSFFRHVLPRVGQSLAPNHYDAYEYLPRSVLQFPEGQAMLDLMTERGLANTQQHRLTLGVATLYVGTKPAAESGSALMGTTVNQAKPLNSLREILGMIRFSHTLFALPFALLGAVLAAYRGRLLGNPSRWTGWASWYAWSEHAQPRWRLTAWWIATWMPETPAPRHGTCRPAGLSVRSVALFTLASAADLSWPERCCSCRVTRGPCSCSAPVLAWLLGYSYAKRFTSLAHFWLGLSLAMAPVAAWIAIRGGLDWPPALAGAGRPVLGVGVRHHLRVPGRGIRPGRRPAQRARPPGQATCASAGRRLPCSDGAGATGARVVVPDGLALSCAAWRRWLCCWCTSTRSSARTTCRGSTWPSFR